MYDELVLICAVLLQRPCQNYSSVHAEYLVAIFINIASFWLEVNEHKPKSITDWVIKYRNVFINVTQRSIKTVRHILS